jgi:hypothetical protein
MPMALSVIQKRGKAYREAKVVQLMQCAYLDLVRLRKMHAVSKAKIVTRE